MREEPLFRFVGSVIHGRGNGRAVGMPTANLDIPKDETLPPYGVYAAWARIDGKWYRGVTNVGLRPTLRDGGEPTVETLLLDFSGDLYGKEMELRLYRFLRETRKMASLKDVEKQVEKDAAEARRLLAGRTPEG